MAEQQVPEPTKTPTPEEKLMEPMTNQPTNDPEISDKEKEKYFRCFLADKHYEEEISLLKGKFKITVRTLSVRENNNILKQITLDQERGIARNNDGYFVDMLNYRLSSSLVNINGAPFGVDVNEQSHPFPTGDKKDSEFFVRERSKLLHELQTFKLIAVTEAFRTFERKIQIMTNNIQNENFWKAVVQG